jgi:prepilin-type N-terminal cleavage/methylation domain-containing protein
MSRRPFALTRSPAFTRPVRARGYTAIEVLLAMTMMAIGAAAVMSMQKASLQGNYDARTTDVANSIARLWVERLRQDSMLWTLPNAANPTVNNLSNALILNNTTGSWFLPTQYINATPSVSPGFDILGRDVPQASLATAPLFCVHVRLTYLIQDATNPQNNMIRADVRVLWPRGIATTATPVPICNAALATSIAPDPTLYHAIYVTTAIRENGAP